MNAELGFADVGWVLESLASASEPLVLIGGQALNYWCDRYRVQCPDLEQHGPFASKDIDFQATKAVVPWCSQRLGGSLCPVESGEKNTLLNGVVTVPSREGREPFKVDFLQRPYGDFLEQDVVDSSASVTVHISAAEAVLKIMHPLHLPEKPRGERDGVVCEVCKRSGLSPAARFDPVHALFH